MIEIFTSKSCSICLVAKKTFNEMKLDYIELDISNKESYELLQKVSISSTLPQILINRQNLYVGFSIKILKEILQDLSYAT